MNIFGMGLMELAVVLLVAFLVLGPSRSIEMARKSGKVLGDLRRTFSDVTDAIRRGPTTLAVVASSIAGGTHTARPP